MPSIEQNYRSWNDPDGWEDHGDEWSRAWGSPESMWFGTILPRIAPCLPAEHLLEIACGQGRVTRFLIGHASRLIGVDLTPLCVKTCTRRFAETPGAAFFQNDGKSLPMVRDASVDFAFSWDSLVHCDATVIASYIAELARTLRLGGRAFLHHSNLGAFTGDDGRPTVENPHWRDPSVSAELVRTLASRHGLVVASQELLQWSSDVHIDCFTVLRRPLPDEPAPPEPVIFEQPEMGAEMHHFAQLDRVYRG